MYPKQMYFIGSSLFPVTPCLLRPRADALRSGRSSLGSLKIDRYSIFLGSSEEGVGPCCVRVAAGSWARGRPELVEGAGSDAANATFVRSAQTPLRMRS